MTLKDFSVSVIQFFIAQALLNLHYIDTLMRFQHCYKISSRTPIKGIKSLLNRLMRPHGLLFTPSKLSIVTVSDRAVLERI